MKKYKFLVTGGGGFIGSNLAERLLEEGHFVRVFDNFLTGKRENLKGFGERFGKRFELFEGDLRDRDAVRRAVAGVDYVFHQGAYPSVPVSLENPSMTEEINVGGTINVLEAARESGIKRVVFASSTAIYGDTEALPVTESESPDPKSPYALQKLSSEYYLKIFHDIFHLESVALRYFNIFGPRQDPASTYAAVIPRFVTALLSGERPVIYGDGTQSRDFTYVENVVEANIKACFAPKEACGRAYNIACGERYSLLDLIAHLEEIIGVKADPVFEPERPGDVKHSQGDISLARKYLGYEVKVGFREGLERTVAWYRERVKS